jgi:hypothetical protein
MALIKSTRGVQVVIGTGAVAGDIIKGGIYIRLNASGNFVGLSTSTDGTDIKELETLSGAVQVALDSKLDVTAQAVDSALLGGQTQAQIATAIVNQITNGAGTAYDTLIELENEIKANDTDLATILTTQSTKVDKVVDSSLVTDTEITKLAGITTRADVRATGATTTDLPNETAIRLAIEEAKAEIDENSYFVPHLPTEHDLRVIPYPISGGYSKSGYDLSGWLQIKLPRAGTKTMLSFELNMFQFSTHSSTKLFFAFYLYDSVTLPPTFSRIAIKPIVPIEDFDFVHLGRILKAGAPAGSPNANDYDMYIYIGRDIGITAFSFAYPKIWVSNLMLGHDNVYHEYWNTDWDISIAPTIPVEFELQSTHNP